MSPSPKFGAINISGYKGRLWCGGAALSIVTGKPFVECWSKLQEIAGTKLRDGGVWSWQVRQALDDWGYVWEHRKFCEAAQPKLERLQMSGFAGYSPVIVGLSDHFIVCYKEWCCDRFSIYPESRFTFGHFSRRVLSYIRVKFPQENQ